MKKLVLAFDSFKGCMSAQEACAAASSAIHNSVPDASVISCPLSDGGEGLVACVQQRLEVETRQVQVHGPLMEPVIAQYAVSSDGPTAYMEMAAASGLPLVPPALCNPMLTTTYGVGEMMVDAVRRGCKKIMMGIGGSATCDGGKGMVEALEAANMMGTLRDEISITVACDVDNPLYGERGAAYVFAPQKGATPEQVIALDSQLRAFTHATESAGIATPELADFPGAGAAGGLGYALLAYLHAELKPGIDIVLDLSDFDHLIAGADLVITGEGKSDAQTLMGKVPYGVLKRCKAQQIPVWLMSGAIDDADHSLSSHFDRVYSINEGDSRPLPVLMQKEVALTNLKHALSCHLSSL